MSKSRSDPQQTIDRLADEFERAFRAGLRPRIENFLDLEPALGTELLVELVLTEFDLRREFGDHVAISEYVDRFGEVAGLNR